jgi:hypothetical protein
MVPVRPVADAETVKFTDPTPDMPPLVIVIQGTELVAVHPQPEPVMTERLPFSPVNGADTLAGDTLKVQLPVACVMVTVLPPTVSVPVRMAPVPFAATEKLNDPSPDMPPLVTVIQGAKLTGDHAQALPVVTPMLLLRPVDGAETFNGDTLYVHCASTARTSRTKTSAIRTPQRRSVIHHPFLERGGTQLRPGGCSGRCIRRAADTIT